MESASVPLSGYAHVNTRYHLIKRILAHYCDGEFHLVCDIATGLDADIELVGAACYRLVARRLYQTFGERRPAARSAGKWAYRFVQGGKTIDVTALYAELQPILAEADKLLHGHNVDYSKDAMKLAFASIRKVIDRMAR